MKNPYEFGGILFTIAILGGVLGGVAFDNYNGFPHGWKDVTDNGVHDMSMTDEKDWSKYIPLLPKHDYNNYYNSCPDMASDPEGYDACHKTQEVQECKKTSKNYEEFFDCVNCPDPVKCEMKWDWMDNQK